MAQPVRSTPGPAGLLFTGGCSRRMGQDKASLVVGGERLADRIARLLGAVADPVIEVGPGYTDLACAREEVRGSGPLAALAAGAAALRATGDESDRPALVVATDLPNLTAGLLRFLAAYPARGCIVPLDRSGHIQPMCARYSHQALALAPELLATGRRSLMALLERVATVTVTAADWEGPAGRDDALVDLDTPQDLADFEARR